MGELFTIDRFERDYAVLEDGDRKMRNVRRERIQTEAQEGDVVVYDALQDFYKIDCEATRKRKKEIADLMRRLFQ